MDSPAINSSPTPPESTAEPTVENGGIILIHNCKEQVETAASSSEMLVGLESLLLSSNSMGTLIDSQHERYAFICNMLTGIKICTLKAASAFDPAQQHPTHQDYSLSVKMHFKRGEKVGCLDGIVVKQPFEFKEYAPGIFARLRALYRKDSDSNSKADSDEAYLEELTSKFQMNEMGSPGKSGCFLYYSHSYQYIIKTIRKAEAKFLVKILPDFYRHHCAYGESLLAKYCGLYRLGEGGSKKHFVVMLNIFPPNRSLEEVYDIKGATFGRRVSLKAMQNFIVMKDMNILENRRRIYIEPAMQVAFMLQLERDVGFLIAQRAMDYSLLLGISKKQEGEKDQELLHPNSLFRGNHQMDYYMGIIDVLTPYNWKKKLEHFFRGCCIYRNEISAVSPPMYGQRFLGFVQRLFRGLEEREVVCGSNDSEGASEGGDERVSALASNGASGRSNNASAQGKREVGKSEVGNISNATDTQIPPATKTIPKTTTTIPKTAKTITASPA